MDERAWNARAYAYCELLERKGFSCAESCIRTLFYMFDESPDIEILRATSSFRGGAGIDGKCGIVESALAFLSYFLAKQNLDVTQEALTGYAKDLQKDFSDKFGSVQCPVIWGKVLAAHGDIDTNGNVPCIIKEGTVQVAACIQRIVEGIENI